jgi:hypothetical protein
MTSLSARRDALRQQVNQDFNKLRSAVDNLGEAVQERTDLGRAMQRQPYAWLGCALILGLAVGSRPLFGSNA